ncbi:putative transcription factor NAM family [Helianthus debilis subsp. tardiflorus]
MNSSVTHHNTTTVVNINNHSKLNDPSLFKNTQQQQQSSASNCINGCYPCLHCQCGCHSANTMKVSETAYLDSLPTGCRFLPTDKELIVHYLRKKINNQNLPKTKISEANVYGYHPKDLTANYPQAIEGIWYFFSSRDRKYARGNRPRRSAGPGYWKANGIVRVIKDNEVKIGNRKLLIYYEGHQPNGTKTSWMMHEYVVEGYETRQPLGSDDKKFDDYVLCKIYKNGRMEQPCVTSNESHPRAKTRAKKAKRQVENPIILQVENNVAVQQPSQNSNPTIHHGESRSGANTRAKEAKRQVMVRDQCARVVSSQDINPTIFQVENNVAVQQPNQDSNPTSRHGESHLRTKTRAKEAKRQVMVRDQHARVVSSQDINPTIFQVENNVAAQDFKNMGSLYDLIMKSATRDPKHVETSSLQPTRAPLVHQSCPTRLDHNFSLQKPPFSPPTQQRSQSLPPVHRHGHPGMYMFDPSSNPPSPQVALTAFQDDNECDGCVIFEQNIKLMIAKDGYGDLNFDDNDRFQLNRHKQMDTDESKKHA